MATSSTPHHYHQRPAVSSSNKKTQPVAHSRNASKSAVSLPKTKSLSHGKLTKLGKQKDDRAKHRLSAREEDEMAASFPNFCTVCDKQIHHPELSILYCSKACKAQDTNKRPSLSTRTQSYSPSTPLANMSFDDHVRNIVPRQSPTTPTANRFSFSEASSDDNTYSEDEHRPTMFRNSSEAARYLAQFQSQTALDQLASRTPRRSVHRSQASTSAAPSLSSTPASTMSMSMPYTPSTRPLPPRNNPWGSYGTKSTDLVQPFTSIAQEPVTAPSTFYHQSSYTFKARPSTAAPSMGVVEGELHSYEKLTNISSTPVQGSIKALLDFTKMQAPPSAAN